MNERYRFSAATRCDSDLSHESRDVSESFRVVEQEVAALVVPFTAETVGTPILQMGGFLERGSGKQSEPEC